MPDTGAPYNIPFLDGTEFVKDYPDFSEDLADAIVDGLDAAGGLVAVKHEIRTTPQTFSNVGGGDNRAVGGLSITHTMADANNRLIISAYFGNAANSRGQGDVGIAVADDGTLIGIADADGNRTQVGAGGAVATGASKRVVTMPSVTFVHEPGDTAEHTYTVRAINIQAITQTMFINRNEDDLNQIFEPRASSALTIMEVKV